MSWSEEDEQERNVARVGHLWQTVFIFHPITDFHCISIIPTLTTQTCRPLPRDSRGPVGRLLPDTPQIITRRDIASDARLARNFLHVEMLLFIRVRIFDIYSQPPIFALAAPYFPSIQINAPFRWSALVRFVPSGQDELDSRCCPKDTSTKQPTNIQCSQSIRFDSTLQHVSCTLTPLNWRSSEAFPFVFDRSISPCPIPGAQTSIVRFPATGTRVALVLSDFIDTNDVRVGGTE